MIKLASWNVNGIRAASDKGFRDYVGDSAPDILCLQETKATPEQVELPYLEGYEAFWNPASKKGYSGTAVFTRLPPRSADFGMGISEHDGEGRVVHLEFDAFHLVNVYTPNSQRGLVRLPYRLEWDEAFREYVGRLKRTKPVAVCGDFNCAHEEIDLTNPKANRKNAGFSDEERESFGRFLGVGMVDTFRHFDKSPGQYTWWTYRSDARQRNIGWRIDYWCVSQELLPAVKASRIRQDVYGSDHCPVELDLDLNE